MLLVAADCVVRRNERRSAVAGRRVEVPAQASQILDGRQRPGDSFMALRAGHPFTRQIVGRRPQLVGSQPLESLAASPQHAHVRAKKLVCRGDQVIAIPAGHIRQQVRRGVHGIDEQLGPHGVSQPGNLGYRIDRANRVRVQATATSLVRGESLARKSSRSSVQSAGRMFTCRTLAPASRAASTQGVTLAS